MISERRRPRRPWFLALVGAALLVSGCAALRPPSPEVKDPDGTARQQWLLAIYTAMYVDYPAMDFAPPEDVIPWIQHESWSWLGQRSDDLLGQMGSGVAAEWARQWGQLAPIGLTVDVASVDPGILGLHMRDMSGAEILKALRPRLGDPVGLAPAPVPDAARAVEAAPSSPPAPAIEPAMEAYLDPATDRMVAAIPLPDMLLIITAADVAGLMDAIATGPGLAPTPNPSASRVADASPVPSG